MQVTFKKLRLFNLGVGLFQLFTGAVICGITDYGYKSKLPWYTHFIASWSRDNDLDDALFYVPVPKKQVNFPVGLWSGIFLLLSAADHLLVAAPYFNGVYNRNLCLNRNPFRWLEYAVSASLMQVMIAQLCGVTDIHILWSLFFLMGTCMLFGWLMEAMNGHKLPTYRYGCMRQPGMYCEHK